MLPGCRHCDHGQAGHGGRRCIYARPIMSSWESTHFDDAEECGCTEPATIDEMKQVYNHYAKMARDALKRLYKAICPGDCDEGQGVCDRWHDTHDFIPKDVRKDMDALRKIMKR